MGCRGYVGACHAARLDCIFLSLIIATPHKHCLLVSVLRVWQLGVGMPVLSFGTVNKPQHSSVSTSHCLVPVQPLRITHTSSAALAGHICSAHTTNARAIRPNTLKFVLAHITRCCQQHQASAPLIYTHSHKQSHSHTLTHYKPCGISSAVGPSCTLSHSSTYTHSHTLSDILTQPHTLSH